MKKSGPYKTYKGKIDPKSLSNPQKYVGDINNIVYRSFWERQVVFWLDTNPNVLEYASEEIFFPYNHPISGKRAKYYPDFYIKMIDGVQRVVEVKPLKEVNRPEEPKRKTKHYYNAIATWVINQEKWKAAEHYCNKHNLKFEVWHENILNEMGIMRSKTPKTKMLTERKKSNPKTNRPKRRS